MSDAFYGMVKDAMFLLFFGFVIWMAFGRRTR